MKYRRLPVNGLKGLSLNHYTPVKKLSRTGINISLHITYWLVYLEGDPVVPTDVINLFSFFC